MFYKYKNVLYPDYLKEGNACRFIIPAAAHFCKGKGLDVGAGKWLLPGSTPIDLSNGGNAYALPAGKYNYIFSSHCLEHLPDPVGALEHWAQHIIDGGVLFLYLPHPQMQYWLPQNCRKHLHTWTPREMNQLLVDLGFTNVIRSDGWDSFWSFMVVGFKAGGEDKLSSSDAPPPSPPDAAFRWLINESSDHVHKDPQLASIFKKFGADAFRRSSAVEVEFEKIIKEQNFKGKRCVEIGSYNGITALVLARYFDEVISFDIFPHTIKHTIAEFCGVKNIQFIDIKDNDDKARILAKLDFDAAYVDGNHEQDTESDFELVKKCKRTLFHEYWTTQMPVWKLINRLKGADPASVVVQGKFALWRGK